MLSLDVTFDEFARLLGPRLRAALIAAYGTQVGVDCAAEALAYGWEHWDRLRSMSNPAGYLYRVGQTAARRGRRPDLLLPSPAPQELPMFDPGLIPALQRLTEPQRVAVMLVHGYGWSQAEVADILDVSHATVRTHVSRALAHLRRALEEHQHVDQP